MSGGISGSAPEPPVIPPRWEYRVERWDPRGPEMGLAALGGEGWELAAASLESITGAMVLWFKRPMP